MFKMMLYDWMNLTRLGTWRLYSEPTIECVDYCAYIIKRYGSYYACFDDGCFLVGNTPRQALDQLYRFMEYSHKDR